jgi:hypothetical protein
MRLAISVRQPWAWLIMHGGKNIENRDWPTKVRGRVLIHASKGCTYEEYESALITARGARKGVLDEGQLTMPSIKTIERGGIIGSVEIVDCVSDSPSPWFFGRFGFVLRNPIPCEFRPMRGMLGFFQVPEVAP